MPDRPRGSASFWGGQGPVIIGAGLKMYLGHRQTLEWVDRVSDLALRHPGVRSGDVELFVLPSFPTVAYAVSRLAPVGVGVGAQDLFWEDRGPFTGEVSGSELAEIGCRYAEVGHLERRKHLGETDEMVSAKTAAALRNGLTPIICVGESEAQDADRAAFECVDQLRRSLASSEQAGVLGAVLVAYEPHWAIGAEAAADSAHIRTVCSRLQQELRGHDALGGSRVIYGGSAGPGLLGQLGGATDGLFVGRSSHDPAVLESILDEAAGAAP